MLCADGLRVRRPQLVMSMHSGFRDSRSGTSARFERIAAFLLPALVFSLTELTASAAEDVASCTGLKGQAVGEVDGRCVNRDDVEALLWSRGARELVVLDAAGRENAVRTFIGTYLDRVVLLAEADTEKIVLEQTDSQSLRGLSAARDDLRVVRYLERAAYADLAVSVDELRARYDAVVSSYVVPEERNVEQILVPVPPARARDPEWWRTVATNVRNLRELVLRSRGGMDAVLRDYLPVTFAVKKVELGFVTREQLPDEIADIVFGLLPGALSDMVRTDQGLHILRVKDVRPGSVPSLEELRSHLESEILSEKRRERLRLLLETLREKHRVVQYHF